MKTKQSKAMAKAARATERDALKLVLKHQGGNPRRSQTARKLFDIYAHVKTVGAYREAAKKITPFFSAYFLEDRQHGYVEVVGEARPAPRTKAAKATKAAKPKAKPAKAKTAKAATKKSAAEIGGAMLYPEVQPEPVATAATAAAGDQGRAL